jgi:cytochrome c peroxidase
VDRTVTPLDTSDQPSAPAAGTARRWLLGLFVGVAALPALFAGYRQANTASDTQAADLEAMRELYRRPDAIPFPPDNPFSDDKMELGRQLFFDPRLSGSNSISCATCHNPSFAWEDGMPVGIGHGTKPLGRHTPTILNLAWGELFFWDGRAESLEAQALGPVQSDVEMHQSVEELLIELGGIDGYVAQFNEAFPGEGLNERTLAAAIATFERTIVSNLAPFDRWIAGDPTAISDSAQRGFVIFNTTANCAACHSSWTFTDSSFHDIGLASEDPGRGKLFPDVPELAHGFKTPGLRNIVERAPYMHDGSIATLRQVIDHYAGNFVSRPTLSADIFALELSEQDKQDLEAFLKTLSSNDDPQPLPILPN